MITYLRNFLIGLLVLCHIPLMHAQDKDIKYDSRSDRAWFATGIYSINIANNGFTYSKVGLMGGYIGNWGGYAKVAFDLVGNITPNIVGGFTKRLVSFRHTKAGLPSTLHMYFGVGCGNVEHATKWRTSGEYVAMPDGSVEWIASGPPPKTHWDGGTSVLVETGLIYRYQHINLNLGYSIVPDLGLLAGSGESANHSIQIGIGYTF